MPGQTILEIPASLQEQMVQELRQSRFGHLLALHILLLCAAGRTPTEIAAFLLCSRSSVYRTVAAYRRGEISLGGQASEVQQPGIVRRYLPSLQRSLLSILKCVPHKFGWCRTRWSRSTLAAELHARRGVAVSPEKMRRWLHSLDYVWKRARHVAKDSDPERITRLARIRHIVEHLRPSEVQCPGAPRNLGRYRNFDRSSQEEQVAPDRALALWRTATQL